MEALENWIPLGITQVTIPSDGLYLSMSDTMMSVVDVDEWLVAELEDHDGRSSLRVMRIMCDRKPTLTA